MFKGTRALRGWGVWVLVVAPADDDAGGRRGAWREVQLDIMEAAGGPLPAGWSAAVTRAAAWQQPRPSTRSADRRGSIITAVRSRPRSSDTADLDGDCDDQRREAPDALGVHPGSGNVTTMPATTSPRTAGYPQLHRHPAQARQERLHRPVRPYNGNPPRISLPGTRTQEFSNLAVNPGQYGER